MKLEIHVPHTDGYLEARRDLVEWLSIEHGGCYITEATGYWINPDKDDFEPERDKVDVIVCYDDRLDVRTIHQEAVMLAGALHQEAIFYAINENGHLAFPDGPVPQIPLRNRY